MVVPGKQAELDVARALQKCPGFRMDPTMPTMIPNALEGHTALIPIERCIGCKICVRNQPEHLRMLEW